MNRMKLRLLEKMLRYSIHCLKSAMLQLTVCYKMVLFKTEEIALSKKETVGSDGI